MIPSGWRIVKGSIYRIKINAIQFHINTYIYDNREVSIRRQIVCRFVSHGRICLMVDIESSSTIAATDYTIPDVIVNFSMNSVSIREENIFQSSASSSEEYTEIFGIKVSWIVFSSKQ